MKSGISILLVLVYFSTLFVPMNPVIHYVLHKKYYKEILCVNRANPRNCCQGKCQLKKEISQNEKSGDKTTAIPIPKIQTENISICLLLNTIFDFNMKLKSGSLISYVDPFLKVIYPQLLSPPPKL